MSTLIKPPTLEQYLHEIDQRITVKDYESYFRKHVVVDKDRLPNFTGLIIDVNYSIIGHVNVVNPCDEPILQQFLKATEGASNARSKALIILDICKIDNGFIDNEIINFAYMVQEGLAAKGVLLMDYILASKHTFVSLRNEGIL